MTSPMDSSRQMTSTCMTGSRSLGPHLAMPSRNAPRAAISNAITEESTSW